MEISMEMENWLLHHFYIDSDSRERTGSVREVTWAELFMHENNVSLCYC